MLAFTLPVPVEYYWPPVFLSHAIALTAADVRVVRVNREFTRLFGSAPQEALVRCRYMHQVAHVRRVDAQGGRWRRDGSRLRVAMPYVPFPLHRPKASVYAT